MSNIYLTSDLHFCHNRGFLYEPRGFDNVYDMNKVIIDNWNAIVKDDDVVYILGDIMLNNNDEGRKCFNQLKGIKHIVRGNHDTKARLELYKDLRGVVDIVAAEYLDYGGYHFYLSHYPTFTANLEKESLKQCLINLYGHTHQKTNFYNDIPFMYHVGLDSHDNKPVLLDDIIEECKEKCKECLNML